MSADKPTAATEPPWEWGETKTPVVQIWEKLLGRPLSPTEAARANQPFEPTEALRDDHE